MSEEGFGELCVEVRRSQAIAKPIIARSRPDGKREIVDGEHNWRAAKEEGLKNVPCVMVSMDDFDAMRETYKRNQGGTHDPLREALMFEKQRALRGFSVRKLARENNLKESTLRCKLKYLNALALRKGCAVKEVRNICALEDEDCQKISALSLAQVDAYVELPEGFRNRWLDHGAKITLLKHSFFFKNREICNGKQLLEQLDRAGLLNLVDLDRWMISMDRLGKFSMWCGDHTCVHDVCAYVRPVAELRLNIAVLDALPYEPAGGGASRVMLTAAVWEQIVRGAAEQTKDATYQRSLIVDRVRAALVESGLDPAEALTIELASMLDDLCDAPTYIRDAKHLSIEERYDLHTTVGYVTGEMEEQAKRMVIEEFARRRNDSGEPKQFDGSTVIEVYRQCARRLQCEESNAREEDILDDTERVKEELLAKICHDEAMQLGEVQGRPARHVLAEELDDLNPAMLTLVAAALLFPYSSVKPAARWFQAVGGTISLHSAGNSAK